MDNRNRYIGRLNNNNGIIGSGSDGVVTIGKAEASSSNYLHLHAASEPDDESGSHIPDRFIKSQIANHPLYPNLLSAFLECHKVGAPPEVTSLLEEIGRENHPINASSHISHDPELDHFMESYCGVLHRYKEELSKPFNEATLFLGHIQSQLTDLCKGTLTTDPSSLHLRSDERDGSSEMEEGGSVEVEECCGSATSDKELKEMLLRKYSGYLSSLRKEFLKKRKKGKLPKDARMALLHWWNSHYRWPYPTEEEKVKLSEMTGLDQKQINNWFINQRKRHWKPSEDMRFAIMEGSGDISGAAAGGQVYLNSGGGGPQRT